MFAKKIYKIGMIDRQFFFSEGVMNSAADAVRGEVSPPGYVGLCFQLLKCDPTGVLNIKATNGLTVCGLGGR